MNIRGDLTSIYLRSYMIDDLLIAIHLFVLASGSDCTLHIAVAHDLVAYMRA